MNAGARPGRALIGLVRVSAVGILLQALSAGQFISGAANLVGVHAAVGTGLEAVGVALVVAAVIDRRTRRLRRGWWSGALALGVALVVQAALGHAPGAVPTAIHVPVGVVLSATVAVLVVSARRPPAPQADRRPAAATAPAGQP